jgi:hypothetical protein
MSMEENYRDAQRKFQIVTFLCVLYTKLMKWMHNGEGIPICVFHLQNYSTDFDETW